MTDIDGLCPAQVETAGKTAGEVAERQDDIRLKFGVLADIHIDERHFAEPGGGHSVRVFKTALQCLCARSVDGVVICGDLTQDGRIAELRRLAETWREVFPNDRRPDGGRVERLFAFGDHDVERPYLLLKHWPEQLEDPKVIADMRENHIAYVDRAKVWKDVFHEDFAPIMRRTIKGYDFVLAHLVNKDEDGLRYADPLYIPGLEEFFEAQAFDRTKPLFYVQHKIPRGTVGGRHQSGQDAGRTSAILSRHPNAVGFCGHKHRTATEELSLWQGAFTQIQAPGLASLLTAAGRENSRCSCEAPCSTPPQQMDQLDTRLDGSHALVATVYADRMEIDRIDILHGGEAVAEPWIVRLPNDGSAAYERRGKTAPVPQFAAGAKVKIATRLGKDRAGTAAHQVVVSFPPAHAPRAYDYEVTALLSKGVVTRVAAQKRVYSPKCYWPERHDTDDVVCVFSRAEISDNHESVRFVVRPMNAWGAAGEPIESEDGEFWAKGALYPF
ncbi:MAG: metallophosphoesterase family protein [Kiritimatiellia bacterium]